MYIVDMVSGTKVPFPPVPGLGWHEVGWSGVGGVEGGGGEHKRTQSVIFFRVFGVLGAKC